MWMVIMNHNSAILPRKNAGVLTMMEMSWREPGKAPQQEPIQHVNVSITIFFLSKVSIQTYSEDKMAGMGQKEANIFMNWQKSICWCWLVHVVAINHFFKTGIHLFSKLRYISRRAFQKQVDDVSRDQYLIHSRNLAVGH